MKRRSCQPTLPALLKKKRVDTEHGEDHQKASSSQNEESPELVQIIEPSSSGLCDVEEIPICSVESNEDKENERPPNLEELLEDELGCPEVAVSSSDEVYSVGSEDDYIGSPESKPSGPLTPLANGYTSTWTRFRTLATTAPLPERSCPLPSLPWADEKRVWLEMCRQDEDFLRQRHPDVFAQHPRLQPRMRAVLLDWLAEVCEVYRLHRETYNLAMDFHDRYLALTNDIPKTQLQLIGITCLFIAAKMEEIYPPKIGEFAYVTDGACTESEILAKELVILKCLEWRLNPLTVNYWLNMYMQLVCNHRRNAAAAAAASSSRKRYSILKDKGGSWRSALGSTSTDEEFGSSFVYPQYSGLSFTETAQLLDLATLDAGCLRFTYGTLATAALCHTVSKEIALRFSGMSWEMLEACVRWMEPFAITLLKEGPAMVTAGSAVAASSQTSTHSSGLNKTVPNIVTDDSHNIQTHCVNLEMLEHAQEIQQTWAQEEEVKALGLLTPPSSGCKRPQASGSMFT